MENNKFNHFNLLSVLFKKSDPPLIVLPMEYMKYYVMSIGYGVN
ncbi:MAG: hypothetical protein SRB2_04105 [Desulfobacteraceae bacterium Eth-SRB2]|nr:MAG: hypothetical protein SRB2_04105 [Desulfobacteraceae bacterium Eth-SRB2]